MSRGSDAAILLERSKARPAGWFSPADLDMAIDFHALSEPHYAASGTRGHFEQTGRASGSITIGGRTHAVAGYGVPDKSWGPRDWGAGGTGSGSTATIEGPAPFVNWFSMNFGPALALGGSCFRAGDGVMRGAGWIQRDGRIEDLDNVVIETTYAPGSILHTGICLTGRAASGAPIAIEVVCSPSARRRFRCRAVRPS